MSSRFIQYPKQSQLFLHFRGPTTILVQTRGSRLRDVLSMRDVNEIADSPAGAVQSEKSPRSPPLAPTKTTLPRMRFAEVGKEGQVRFEKS
jgi:hypothetical protein